jgi:hypothetical protein
MSLAMVELCRDCDDDLEHCHGTVFRHEDGSFECLEDPDYYAPPEALRHLCGIGPRLRLRA